MITIGTRHRKQSSTDYGVGKNPLRRLGSFAFALPLPHAPAAHSTHRSTLWTLSVALLSIGCGGKYELRYYSPTAKDDPDCADKDPLAIYPDATAWNTSTGATDWHVTACAGDASLTHYLCLNDTLYTDTVPCADGSACDHGVCSGIQPPYCIQTNPLDPSQRADPSYPGYAEVGTVAGLSAHQTSSCGLTGVGPDQAPTSVVSMPFCQADASGAKSVSSGILACPADTLCLTDNTTFGAWCRSITACDAAQASSNIYMHGSITVSGPDVPAATIVANGCDYYPVTIGDGFVNKSGVTSYGCHDGKPTIDFFPCPEGEQCLGAVCVKECETEILACTETDPDHDPVLAGATTVTRRYCGDTQSERYQDMCDSNQTIWQASCETGQYELSTCPSTHPYCIAVPSPDDPARMSAICSAAMACLDTDPYDLPGKFGTVQLLEQTGAESPDYCVNNIVHQFNCAVAADGQSTIMETAPATCPNGCEAGACL